VISGQDVAVKGPKGELAKRVADPISVTQDDGVITLSRATDRGPHRALHGLSRALIANMVTGVSEGFERHLELQGVGYRAAPKGAGIRLSVGYSHPVDIDAPEGITLEVPETTQIIVRGIDKQAVGQIAAKIRKVRPPEPYKGKGIRYRDEEVQRKVGKRA
jgi:large subunit ribosomal protein L6